MNIAFDEDGVVAGKIKAAVTVAKQNAALPTVPPVEEQLIALTAAQDVEGRQGDEKAMFDLYRRAQEGGDLLRANHLSRLIEPRTTERPEFQMLKIQLKTPQEVERDATVKAADSLRAQIPMLRSYLDKNIEENVEIDQDSLGKVLDQIETNVRQAASTASAALEKTSA